MESNSKEKIFVEKKFIPRFSQDDRQRKEQKIETFDSLREFTRKKFTEKGFYDKLRPMLDQLLEYVKERLLT